MPEGADKDPAPAFAIWPRKHAGGTSFIERGRGEPLIFIHGVGLNAEAWWPQIEQFSLAYRVIAIDMLGHGESALPPSEPTLETYVDQLARLLTDLNITKVNVVGHSMGSLVAIGFAFAYPQMTLRLAALNSVYERTPEQRAAVVARAQEIRSAGTVGNIRQPLERWFGVDGQQTVVGLRVGQMLSSANPVGYAAAYSVFARSDRAFTGRLGSLQVPVLFATGSNDINSTPAMTLAMASAVPQSKAVIVEDARHMMNVTHQREIGDILSELLRVATPAIDRRDLRNAFGAFMTGVTVVTTREPNGLLRGFTANSFSSVSMDPPLLLVCISKAAASCDSFAKAQTFAINILAENQKSVSGVFASKRPDKFSEVAWTESRSGNPLLEGAVAWFDCNRHDVVDAGDHLILIGNVTSYAHNSANPLGYARGGYFTLGLEQSAVNAAAQAGRTEVGAILESDGKLLAFPTADGKYELPHVGRGGEAGTVSKLLMWLSAAGVIPRLSFLFAVYENRDDQTQSIYYRGEAEVSAETKAARLSFDDLPWDKFRDDATRAMLRRYSVERLQGRYRIYSGDQVSGDVRGIVE